jgi:prepilin-type N-terminal cleavage/methylation domain-containing protein
MIKTPGLPSREEGFTLPEVLIAIVVLTVALLGMAALTGSLVSAGALSRDRVTAATLAQSKMEELNNIAISSLADGNDTPGDFNRSWTISAFPDPPPTPPVNNAATVAVTVSWQWGGANRSVVLSTIRAE